MKEYTAFGEVYNVKEFVEEICGLPADEIEPDWFEYTVWLMDYEGLIVAEWDSRVETYNGMQQLTEEESRSALEQMVDEANAGDLECFRSFDGLPL